MILNALSNISAFVIYHCQVLLKVCYLFGGFKSIRFRLKITWHEEEEEY